MSSSSPPLTPPTSDSDSDKVPSPPPDPSRLQLGPRAHLISTPSPHPFAASTKADRAPPAYEKKLVTPPATPPEPKKPIPPRHDQAREVATEANHGTQPSIQRSPSVAESEQKRWDVAISSAVDRAETKLDLSSANLTYIPPSIIDLKNLVVLSKLDRPTAITPPRAFTRSTTMATSTRAFTRSTTAPALLPSPHIPAARPFLPSRTTNTLVFGASRQHDQKQRQARGRCDVELYLMRNAIRTLPRELFALDCLVVLSLRQNKLTSLPPAICQLMRLRELNIANNRLEYLPAEILQLRLTSLHLHPNPFTPSPPCPSSKPARVSDTKPTHARNLGPMTRGAPIPTLSELVLRVLLAPVRTTPTPPPYTTSSSSSRSETQLETAMTPAQIDALLLPGHIRRVISASTGHGRASRSASEGGGVGAIDAREDMSRNVCPNPLHRASTVRGRAKGVRFSEEMEEYDAPVFCVPVEERMEWVGVVAGVQIAESPKAWVPVLWRGCGRECLAFLEEEGDPGDKDAFEVGRGEDGEEFEFSDEE